jgi:hypothetical protein
MKRHQQTAFDGASSVSEMKMIRALAPDVPDGIARKAL